LSNPSEPAMPAPMRQGCAMQFRERAASVAGNSEDTEREVRLSGGVALDDGRFRPTLFVLNAFGEQNDERSGLWSLFPG
jgi:hypothetical protein